MIIFFKILIFLPIAAFILATIAVWITNIVKTKSDFKSYSSNLSISFKNFINFYSIFPDKWIISESKDKVYYKPNRIGYPASQDFYFITLKDIIQFRHWRRFVYKKNLKKKQAQETAIRRNKIMSNYVKFWSNDIAEARKDNIEEVKKAIQENAEKVEYYKKRYKELKEEIENETEKL